MCVFTQSFFSPAIVVTQLLLNSTSLTTSCSQIWGGGGSGVGGEGESFETELTMQQHPDTQILYQMSFILSTY